MAKVMFVDDWPEEIFGLWGRSGCASEHQLLPVERFHSLTQALDSVQNWKPGIVFVRFDLGQSAENGADVVRALQKYGYIGKVVGFTDDPANFQRAGLKIPAVSRTPENINLMLRIMKQREERR